MRKISEFFIVCKDCAAPDRHPGCHDTCEYYLKEREKYEDAKNKRNEKRNKEHMYQTVELTADPYQLCM